MFSSCKKCLRPIPRRRGNTEIPLMVIGLIGGLLGGIFIVKLNQDQTAANSTESNGDESKDSASKSGTEPNKSKSEVAASTDDDVQDLTPEELAERAARIKRLDAEARRTRAELMLLQGSVPSESERRRVRREQHLRDEGDPIEPEQSDEQLPPEARDQPEDQPEFDETPRKPNAMDTINYWNSLNTAIDREAADRGRPGNSFTENSAAGFLSRRVTSGHNAAATIRSFPINGVDVQAVQLGRQLAKWYEDNAKVAAQGVQVLASDAKSRQGKAGTDWKAAERQLQTDVANINRSATALQRTLGRRYRTRFPDLH